MDCRSIRDQWGHDTWNSAVWMGLMSLGGCTSPVRLQSLYRSSAIRSKASKSNGVIERIVRRRLMDFRNERLISFVDRDGRLITGNVEGSYLGTGLYKINCSTHT